MKKIFLVVTLLLAVMKITAQSYEENYLKDEKIRLEKVKNTEVEIQNFIEQNINTFDFTEVISTVNTTNGETGQPLSSTEYQNSLNTAKIQKLRGIYFKNNPEKIGLYYAKVLQQCVNGGFEDNGGSTAGYSFASYDYPNNSWNSFTNYVFNISPTPTITPPHQYATLVDNTSPDPNIPSIPRVHSGKFAVRLNQSQLNVYSRNVTSMRRQFVVNENFISYSYALFFQKPTAGHESDTRYPYYQVRLINASNQVLFQRNVNTTAPIFTYNTSNNLLYSGWRCEQIDTSRFMGQFVTLEVTMSNCGNSGHIGYGYFDDFCGLPSDCSVPNYASINLAPQKVTSCPSLPLSVSGNFTTPIGAVFNGIELDVLEAGTGNVITTLPSPSASIIGNYFSFYVNYNDFYPSGINSNVFFNFRARLKYTLNGVQQTVTATNTNPPGPDVSFRGCTTPCFEEIYIVNPVTVSYNYQASGFIYGSSAINPNLIVDYRAGYGVNLLPGFYATGTDKGIFHAYIAPCEGTNTFSKVSSDRPSVKPLDAVPSDSEIKIYPNPASAYFKISTGNEKLISWEMYDLSGKLVLKGNAAEVNVQNILKGNYLLKMNLEKRTITKTIILK
ncbi:hypothetical protein M2347_001593 [Chryseobacterium sp. H1D6B]|uniref:T9SS type A sorting domain-containing protein n=1 Tax=Chryseobacterium sp. H1D6B TaxID=2940588 RepID=UPI0015C99D63|nr:T9SS type A sorting domain-containing protein [Chryseobacterium sp. H1D6B]MDH6251866.1 hypothetical protein [Chryseobacterium sp. H1D6B]